MARRWLARRLSVVIAIVTLAAALFPHSAALAVGSLDQDQPQYCGGMTSVVQGRSSAQTFTAGLSGNLDQIDLLGYDGRSTTFPLRVEVRALVDGAPTGATLGSGSVASVGLGGIPTWTSVALDPAAPVTAGTQYAIVLSTDTLELDEQNGYYLMVCIGDNVYAAGTLWYTSNAAWWPTLTTDLAFRTYVSPADPSTAVADAIASLNLDAKQEDRLITQLERADAFLVDGKTAAAAGQLNGLIGQVRGYVANGTITQADGDELIAIVEAYRSHIESA